MFIEPWCKEINSGSGVFDADTAKRLRLKAQGCFNPGIAIPGSNNPERVASKRRNRVAVDPF
jgi:hypothetical protein